MIIIEFDKGLSDNTKREAIVVGLYLTETKWAIMIQADKCFLPQRRISVLLPRAVTRREKTTRLPP